MTLLEKLRCRQGLAVIASVALCLLLACAGFCQDADKPAGDTRARSGGLRLDVPIREGEVWRFHTADGDEVSRIAVLSVDRANGIAQIEIAQGDDPQEVSVLGAQLAIVMELLGRADFANVGFFLFGPPGDFAAARRLRASDLVPVVVRAEQAGSVAPVPTGRGKAGVPVSTARADGKPQGREGSELPRRLSGCFVKALAPYPIMAAYIMSEADRPSHERVGDLRDETIEACIDAAIDTIGERHPGHVGKLKAAHLTVRLVKILAQDNLSPEERRDAIEDELIETSLAELPERLKDGWDQCCEHWARNDVRAASRLDAAGIRERFWVDDEGVLPAKRTGGSLAKAGKEAVREGEQQADDVARTLIVGNRAPRAAGLADDAIAPASTRAAQQGDDAAVLIARGGTLGPGEGLVRGAGGRAAGLADDAGRLATRAGGTATTAAASKGRKGLTEAAKGLGHRVWGLLLVSIVAIGAALKRLIGRRRDPDRE